MFYGEILSIIVAMTWTATALCAEVASRRMGPLQMNVLRMAASLVILAAVLWLVTGSPLPYGMNSRALAWLLASGAVGYVFGDWCLFSSYILIGSRLGQLFMTLAPAFTALFAFLMLGQTLSWHALLAMAVTMGGIAIAVTDKSSTGTGLPLKGVLFGLGAALGQGLGLVLSKIGLDHYIASVPASLLPSVGSFLPFGSNVDGRQQG